MGVQLINLGKRDAVVGIARNAEAGREAEEVDGAEDADETRTRPTRDRSATDEGEQPSAE